MTEPLTDPRVIRAIELVWREAKLLDDKQYTEWADLYLTDGVYVIPIDPDTEDFASSLNMVYDDDRMRRMRVDRMMQGHAPSAIAAAKTVRTVSRFTVESVSDDLVKLTGAQMVVAYKRNVHSLLAGQVTYEVALDAAGDKLRSKVIRLLNSEDAVTASGFLL